MSGTNSEQAASDHNSPLVRWRTKGTKAAPIATSSANSTRPERESGVVRGSEIMKNVKSSRAPLWSWCSGISMRWPSHSARPNTIAR